MGLVFVVEFSFSGVVGVARGCGDSSFLVSDIGGNGYSVCRVVLWFSRSWRRVRWSFVEVDKLVLGICSSGVFNMLICGRRRLYSWLGFRLGLDSYG